MTEANTPEDWPMTANQGMAESPLHAAAWTGDIKRVKRLIADGADVNWRDSSGETAIFGAASWGHAATVRYLLQAGARHDIAEDHGYTALHWAASHGNRQTVQVLLDAGADILAVNALGKTPLDIAKPKNKALLQQALARLAASGGEGGI